VLEVLRRLRGRHLLHHGIAALYCYGNEVDETLGVGEVLVPYYSRGFSLLRCALEVIPEGCIVENLAQGVVICLPAGRQAVQSVGRRSVACFGGGGECRVEASLALGGAQALLADPWRLLWASEALEHIGLHG